MNRQGYQTDKKNAFSTTAVRDILRNKIYAGYLEYARYINWETKRRQLHIRENEILGIFQQQGEPIQVKDVQWILTSLDRFLAHSEKKQVKALYHTFIEKITFDPNHKEMLEITMKFTPAVVQQLNEQYQIAVSKTKDTAIFVLKTPFTLTI